MTKPSEKSKMKVNSSQNSAKCANGIAELLSLTAVFNGPLSHPTCELQLLKVWSAEPDCLTQTKAIEFQLLTLMQIPLQCVS